jgi:hypothetical protein
MLLVTQLLLTKCSTLGWWLGTGLAVLGGLLVMEG